MRLLTPPDMIDALRPLTVTLGAMADRNGTASIQGLARPLVVTDPHGWLPATALLDGTALTDLLRFGSERWDAAPHAAATLTWKSYSYWLSMPAVLGWAVARRVPTVDATNTYVQFGPGNPPLRLGLRTSALTVLPDDPLAQQHHPDVTVVADEGELLRTLRTSLLDHHLDPLSERIRAEVKVGRRTLLGSVASGIAYGVIRAAHALPGSTSDTISTLLDALDLADLVDLTPGDNNEIDVRRRTCCLAFTLPQPRVCSGCCLR